MLSLREIEWLAPAWRVHQRGPIRTVAAACALLRPCHVRSLPNPYKMCFRPRTIFTMPCQASDMARIVVATVGSYGETAVREELEGCESFQEVVA